MIVSGYHPYPGSEWFAKVWWKQLCKTTTRRAVILSAYPSPVETTSLEWILLRGDLGNCGQLLRREKPHYLPECPAVWLAGMWLAYLAEQDFIYLEQDALAFGGWIEALYSEIGHRQALFGKSAIHGTATSLFIIRHAFIPQFCREYLFEGPEDHRNRIPELKVNRIIQRNPDDMGYYSFGHDTSRPIDTTQPAFFAQKFTPAELRELSQKELLDLPDEEMPKVKLFSNRP
jgi:hypothetical protein